MSTEQALAEEVEVPEGFEKARTPEETAELRGDKPKGDGRVPRTSTTVTIGEKEYVFGDLPDRIARETITPIMAIQKMQGVGGGGLIESGNVIADFLGRFHESTWNSSKNRGLYHQGAMHKDRALINEAPLLDLLKAFYEIGEMLTDPFVQIGLLNRDPEAEQHYLNLVKLMSGSS